MRVWVCVYLGNNDFEPRWLRALLIRNAGVFSDTFRHARQEVFVDALVGVVILCNLAPVHECLLVLKQLLGLHHDEGHFWNGNAGVNQP